MKRTVLWILCILTAALLLLSFPTREFISATVGDIMRITGFISLLAFVIMRTVWKDNKSK